MSLIEAILRSSTTVRSSERVMRALGDVTNGSDSYDSFRQFGQ